MAIAPLDVPRLAILAADRAARRVWCWLRLVAAVVNPIRPNDRLLIAPQDLRTSDPTVASDIYAGRFAFAGKVVATGGGSVWEVEAPSPEWLAAVHGFGWLRHLKAADTALARANARALVDDWIAAPRHDPAAYRIDVTARRVAAFVSQANTLLTDGDLGFYRRFVRTILTDVRTLRHRLPMTPPGQRIPVLVVLALAGLAFERQGGLLAFASRRLDRELARQIASDGSHVSRNPGVAVQLLLDLLPLRQAYAARGIAPPQALQPAVDRLMATLRFFRHGDGAIAAFNGMGPTPADTLATLGAYDESRGRAQKALPQGGYHRLEADGTLVIVDAGPPPPIVHSVQASAAPLAFELSDGAQRIVINCGWPEHARAAWGPVARTTAAHSTLVVDGRSAGHLVRPGLIAGLLGPVLVSGARRVRAERTEANGAVTLDADHDGYVRGFGLIHQRRLTVTPGRLDGEDRIATRTPRAAPAEAVLRFHLHPAVKASRVRDGAGILVVLPNRTAWLFTVEGCEAAVEESIVLSMPDGPRRSEQIVVTLAAGARDAVRWRFIRVQRPDARRGPSAQADLPFDPAGAAH